jgi:hypothetical protein
MAIRLRIVKKSWVALCAVESDEKENDIYLDDGHHEALTEKYARDFNSMYDCGIPVNDIRGKLMESQKVRDAKEELEKWLKEQNGSEWID